ncbi:MAG: 3'-5' exonuclease, partial [Rhodobacteraceae bacterium]|nr:3'-5' exonuclease [Paracoccaceae bacterium]
MSFKAPPGTDLGIPLSSMDAVVIDSETTGLNTNSDRVIELAGVQVFGGRINLEKTKSVLINPGIHIPENSTKIHGISDSTVANATGFEAGIKEFVGWIGPRFILGYSLGFDLSILEAEHKRHGMVWSEPRVLDVEELVQVLAPDLPNLALETIQSWLDIPAQKERHRALP